MLIGDCTGNIASLVGCASTEPMHVISNNVFVFLTSVDSNEPFAASF